MNIPFARVFIALSLGASLHAEVTASTANESSDFSIILESSLLTIVTLNSR